MQADDMELLREYAATGSEEAFSALVKRHVNLVYSVALRRSGDPHLAEEITQSVFILLARKSGTLGARTVLAGWLCRSAGFVSANMLAIHRRRLARESRAGLEQAPDPSPDEVWRELAPLLDDALAELGEKDHNAVVLRFFEGRSFQEIGAALGASEDAAKKRVGRVLDKLRARFRSRGFAFPAAAIAHAVAAHAVQAAPPGLASASAAAAVQAAAAGASLSPLLNTTLKLMSWTKLKATAATAAATLLLAGGSALVMHTLEARTNPSNETSGPQGPVSSAYATPEAAFKSLVEAMNAGDWPKFQAGLTPAHLERMTAKFAGKPAEEIQAYLRRGGAMMAGCQILQKESISDQEVRLLVEVQPTAEHDHVGHDLQVFQRVRKEWRYAGKWGVDVK